MRLCQPHKRVLMIASSVRRVPRQNITDLVLALYAQPKWEGTRLCAVLPCCVHLTASVVFWRSNSFSLPQFTNVFFTARAQFNRSSLITYVPCSIVNCKWDHRPLLLLEPREGSENTRALYIFCGSELFQSMWKWCEQLTTSLAGQVERGALIMLIILPVLPHPINSCDRLISLPPEKKQPQKRRLYYRQAENSCRAPGLWAQMVEASSAAADVFLTHLCKWSVRVHDSLLPILSVEQMKDSDFLKFFIWKQVRKPRTVFSKIR